MKKSVLALIIVVSMAVSSAATVGIMKYLEYRSSGGPIIILSDKRCANCMPEKLEGAIKGIFPDKKIVIVDYNDRKGKKLYKKENLGNLPTVLLPMGLEQNPGYARVGRFAAKGKEFIVLKIGGTFDPTAEICDNSKDDTGNGLVDCADPTCSKEWLCMEKRDKPVVDVFVMSHCPFGTQIEKGILPVWNTLGDKVDLNIRFCDYAMHGKKEIDEELKQYCIQKINKKQYKKYLACFLNDGNSDKCLKTTKIDKDKLASCIKKADKQFNVSKNFKDKKTWKGRFPTFQVDGELVKRYGVQGSPTLVINDVVAKTGRDSKSLLEAICKGFKDKPAECEIEIKADAPSPGFGYKKGAGGGSNASCGS